MGKHNVSLVCSKSRVAPVSPLTLPRLELCAVLLLSRLQKIVRESLALEISKTYLWSDSTIAIQWIKTEPHELKTFVANRVVEIQKNCQSCEWGHVASQDNPADLVSREMMPREILDSNIWRYGPFWLSQDEPLWPQLNFKEVAELPEKRTTVVSSLCMKITIIDRNLLEKYSSIRKLQRVIACIYRFIENSKNKNNKRSGVITSSRELEAAMRTIIKLTQFSEFGAEFNDLQQRGSLSPQSKLVPLNPS